MCLLGLQDAHNVFERETLNIVVVSINVPWGTRKSVPSSLPENERPLAGFPNEAADALITASLVLATLRAG